MASLDGSVTGVVPSSSLEAHRFAAISHPHLEQIAEIDQHVTRLFDPTHHIEASGDDVVRPPSADKVVAEREDVEALSLVDESFRQLEGVD